jgi:hypothetical protein
MGEAVLVLNDPRLEVGDLVERLGDTGRTKTKEAVSETGKTEGVASEGDIRHDIGGRGVTREITVISITETEIESNSSI